jgi:hypothetical protein
MRSTKFLAFVRNAVATAVLGAALLGSFAVASKADGLAVDFTAPYFYFPADPQYTIGWSFTANSNASITGLGWFDHDIDGLNSSHMVGLWTDTGTLLGSALIPGGTGGSLVGQFWFTPLGAPIALTAGNSYVVGGTSGLDPYVTNVSNFTTDSNITFGSMRWLPTGGVLQFPTNFTPGFDPGIFGPNLMINTPFGGGGGAGVPEPGPALTLAGAGVAGLVFIRRRRKTA